MKSFFNILPRLYTSRIFSRIGDLLDEIKKKIGGKDLKEYLHQHAEEVIKLLNVVEIIQANKAAVDLYKAESPDSLLGGLKKLIINEDHRHFIDQVLVFSEGNDRYEGEAKNIDLEGNVLDILIRKTVINRKENGLSKILVSVTDLTQLHASNRERAVLGKKLQQAQRMESIGNLAGGIAHDFNNLLFPIVGMSEILMEDFSPESPEYECAQEILRAGKRGGALVDQILSFSRQTEHKMIPVRIQRILKEVLKLSRSTIPSNIEIEQSLQQDCGSVMADPTQVHQVAMNLITNAFHAVEETDGKINIRLEEKELAADDLKDSFLEAGAYAIFSVSDTGKGIDPSIIDTIFDPYFTTKKKGKGTGLGLAVVYGIVRDHGGDVKVYSEVGKGTVFNIYLPLMEKPPAVQEEDNQVDSYETGSERILLIDDEITIVKLEKVVLERLGYQVSFRVNSYEALEAFKADPYAFDLVITDMTMPGMTGDQLAKEMMAARPDIPVLICTGFSERVSEKMIEEIGIKGILMKPVVKSKMAKMVRTVLDDALASRMD